METLLPASVLVIESHPLMREALCSAIADEPDLMIGMQLEDTAQAMQQLMAFKPDLILLALRNPGLSELEFLKALHNILVNTPILVLTSNDVPGQEQAALNYGAHAVLTKAAPRGELIQALRELRMKAFINYSENKLEQEADENI